MEYEITEIRVEGETVLVVLSSKNDSFGVSVPLDEFERLSETELDAFLKSKAEERVQFLEKLKKQQEADKKKAKAFMHLKGRKIKVRR
ncbi:MAG: hypothetical protein DRJ38_00220 [Thermoprotei archaeon]|nr:MAG: hypothetical protein DRJ38_00220 [Thermoprotei archaeon]